MSKRVTFLIDGFNVYHSIGDAITQTAQTNLKWLNYSSLCRNLINDVIHLQGGSLAQIYYFTALAHHRGAQVITRHKLFMKALESTHIKVVKGNFKEKFPTCKICHTRYKSHEEKESDVNMAMQLMRSFLENECDIAVLMTGDTDLVSATGTAKQLFPTKKVGIAFPYRRANGHFKTIADFTFKLSVDSYKNNQFPDPLRLPDGTVLVKPSLW